MRIQQFKWMMLLLTVGLYAGAARAVETLKLSFSGATATSVQVTQTENQKTESATTWSPTLGTDIVFTTGGGKGNESGFLFAQTSDKTDCVAQGYLSVNCQLRNNQADNWELRLPFTPSETVLVSGVTPGLNVFNGDQSTKNVIVTLTCKVSILQGETAVVPEVSQNITAPNGTSYADVAIPFESTVTLEQGTQYTLVVNVGSARAYDTYAGIKDFVFHAPSSRTLTDATEAWDAADEWTPALVPTDGEVTLTVETGVTLTMEADAALETLTVNESASEGEKSLTFSATGTPTLTVDSLHVNASTDLSALTATLKNVEIASEKTLSVGAGTTLSTADNAAITGAGKLEVKGNLTLSGSNSYTGGTLIGEGATVTLGHKNALGTEGAITGSGTLLWNGVKPGNVNGLNDAETWMGTVKIQTWTEPTTGTGHSALTLGAYGNTASKVELQAVKGYLSEDTTVEALKLTGEGLTFNNGTSQGFTACTINALEGAGQFNGAEDANGTRNWGYKLLVKDAKAFTGTIDLSSERSQRVSVVFGTESALAQSGKIVIDAPVTIASGTTWKAINGIVLTAKGEIKGGGTIASALELARGATIDLTAGPLSVTGDLTLPDAFTVKVSELPEATEWLSLWETSGIVNTSGTTVTVTDGETSAKYTLVNDNGVVELAPPPAVSYEQEPVTFSNKTANSIDLSDGWSLASLKKTDGTTEISQMMGSGAVSQVATYFTPSINVGSGSGAPWVATFSAPEGGRCMDAVTFNFITFNGSGDVQPSTGFAAEIKFDFTLSYVTLADETVEVGTITGANLAGSDKAVPNNAVQTFTFSKPAMVKQLILKADRNESYSKGCFVGLSSFETGTYRGISAIREGTYEVIPSTNTIADKTTSPITMADGARWKVDSCSVEMKTTTANDAVSSMNSILTPDINIGNGDTWTLTFSPTEAGAKVVGEVAVDVVMFNSSGNAQETTTKRALKLTLKNGEEVLDYWTGVLTGTGNKSKAGTATFRFDPCEVSTLSLVATRWDNCPESEMEDPTSKNELKGCYYGVKALEVKEYPSIPAQTVLVNPTTWAAKDQQLGAVFLGASAELPAAPEVFTGCYQAEVFRSLNTNALTTWDIKALTSTGTAITFTQNAGVEMDSPLPEALKPGTPSLSICFDTTPYLGKLGVETMDYIAPADSAILYVGSAEAQADYAGEQWWSSATEGAPATQGALPTDKKPVLWLEGGTITMANAASEVALTFHEETTGGVIEIPEGVTLAYAASSEPSVSNPAIPEGVTVKLGGALTMAGTLPSVEVTSTTAVLGAAAGDNGDLTVNTIACEDEEGNTLTIATGNVTLTDPPGTLALKLGGGNLALTDSANEAITVASLTVTAEGSALQLPEAGLTASALALEEYPLTLEGALTVNALSGTGTITGGGTLTFNGTGSFTGSFEGIHLVVPTSASLTLSGTDTDTLMVATLSGAGELVLSGEKTLGLAQPSTYSGTIELQDDTWLLLDCDQMDSTVLTLANGAQLKDNTDTGGVKTGLNGEMLAVESGAAIVNPENQIAAKVVFKEGAILDLSDGGALNVDAEVELPEGGAVVLKCVAPGNVLRYLGEAVPDLARFTLEDVSGSNALADGYLAAGCSAFEQICVGVLSIERPKGEVFTDEQMQQMANDVFAATGVYGIEFSETLTLSDTAPFECFDGCTTVYDWENEYTIKAQYSFGVADIRIAEKDGEQQVLLAVQVTDGGSNNAALRAETQIQLSKDGGDSYEETALTPLTDEELSAAGLKNSAGVYWYWAEALPEIDAEKTSKTVKYKVRAVNEGTSEASSEE